MKFKLNNLFNFGKNKSEQKTHYIPIETNFYNSLEAPKLIEDNRYEYVKFGNDNLYPKNLMETVKKSSVQYAIIREKSKMMAGNGLLWSKKGENVSTNKEQSKLIYSTMPDDTKFLADFILNNKYGDAPLYDLCSKYAWDYQTFGSFALEIVWSMDWKKIAAVNWIEVKNIRSGKYVNGKIDKYYYARDWSKEKKADFKMNEYDAFDESVQMKEGDDKDKNKNRNYNQIMFIKTGDLEYYGEPPYIAGITYVTIESALADFHLSTVNNGFNPVVAINIYGAEANTDEERKKIVSKIEKNYVGPDKRKIMVFFSQDKNSATEIKTFDVTNLDKQYLELEKQCSSKILTANGVTSPLLFGISTTGQLGANTELETSYKIFNNSSIAYDRQLIEKAYNKILEINGINDYIINIDSFNPFAETETASGITVLAQVLGVGGTQSLLSVMTDAVLTPTQKVNTLVNVFGIDEESAKKMLDIQEQITQ